jgi:Zn-dependent M28 family amino/carboxypeptidase
MRFFYTAFFLLSLCACQSSQTPTPPQTPSDATEKNSESAASVVSDPSEKNSGTHTFQAAINVKDLATHIQTLASDEYEGRSPGTMGERMTTTYLKTELERLGLKPANGDSYFQAVPMVETRVQPGASLTLSFKDKTLTPEFAKGMVIGTRSGANTINITNSDLLFMGYGVSAPEYQWDDYAGVDVKGKTLVVLINDPGFIRKDPDLFKGNTMTYYGRWTYKFEEAARRGAAGVMIIHDTEAASYGWEVIQSGWTRPSFDLPADESSEPRLSFQGWIHTDTAKEMFAAAGHDFEKLRVAADQRGFKSVELGGQASVSLKTVTQKTSSNNVVALLPGTESPEEAILYMAHWDHLGKIDSAPDNDLIFNGATDNASGVSGILEIAAAFAQQDVKPKRSILFLFTTLEESGLLGSLYFSNHPTLPLKNIVAGINLDSLAMRGRAKDVAVTGYGQSSLDALLAEQAKTQDRIVVAEPKPEAGYYFRSDHFNFARKGVPSLYARAGFDLREGGVEAGKAAAADYTTKRYHQTGDEFDPNWDLSGAVEDLTLFYQLGNHLAQNSERPQWSADSEFRAADEARMK